MMIANLLLPSSWMINRKRVGYDPIVENDDDNDDDDDDGIEIEKSTTTTTAPPPPPPGNDKNDDDDDSDDAKAAAAGTSPPPSAARRRGLVLFATSLALVATSFVVVGKMVASPSPPASAPPVVVVANNNGALFYDGQLVDHLLHRPPHRHDSSSSSTTAAAAAAATWSHRYYESTEHFGGPGHPIFLVIGGEGALNNGMLYPYVTGDLAVRFGAAVVQPEHRFFGPYPPVPYDEVSTEELLEIFTPEQAMLDMLRLVVVHLRRPGGPHEGCSPHRHSRDYCPLITVGASYPGYLSSLFRIAHPDVVDAAYAASAPLLMYAQVSDSDAYYDIVTRAADITSPGCAHSVRTTLSEIERIVMDSPSLEEAADAVGVCSGDMLPRSLKHKRGLVDALNLMAVYGFANYDMGNYPPGPGTSMHKICRTFQNPDLDSPDTMRAYLRSQLLEQWEDDNGCDMSTVVCTDEMKEAYLEGAYRGGECFDLRPELDNDVPDAYEEAYDGRKYDDMTMWDFLTCTSVIFLAGQSNTSMFLEGVATYDDLAADCADSFGETVVPRPTELNDRWHYAPASDLVNVSNASRILFTNGMMDMWSGGSYSEDLSDTIIVINFADGAHHSDLTHTSLEYDELHDTDEIKKGKVRIAEILGGWIEEIRGGMVD